MAIKSFFHNLITSGFTLQESDIKLKRTRLINFILLIGIPVNTLFIFGNYASEKYLFAGFNVAMVSVMLLSFFYLRRSEKNIQLAAHGTMLGMLISHLAALLEGGIANSGFVWFFLFPLFALFLTGREAGKKWLGVLFFFILLTFTLQNTLPLPYEPIYLIFVLIALILESLYVLFAQKIQLRYEAELASTNHKLKNLTLDLKSSNHALEQLTQHLQEEVKEQVAIVRSKDSILNQQAKMASVGEMMSFISHQWKQPITTINTAVQNVQLAKELDADNMEELSNETFQTVLTQTELMLSTMQEFLQFSRPSQEKAFTLAHALKMLEQLIGQNFKIHNVLLAFHSCEEELMLWGKENEFVHAIMNIANNAKDIFSDKNTKTGEVIFTIHKEDKNMLLCIQDNAGGIPADIIGNIFEAYFSTKLDKGGTGLGLHMSHKILTETMHGSIDVSNQHGGACFNIRIPIYEA